MSCFNSWLWYATWDYSKGCSLEKYLNYASFFQTNSNHITSKQLSISFTEKIYVCCAVRRGFMIVSNRRAKKVLEKSLLSDGIHSYVRVRDWCEWFAYQNTHVLATKRMKNLIIHVVKPSSLKTIIWVHFVTSNCVYL